MFLLSHAHHKAPRPSLDLQIKNEKNWAQRSNFMEFWCKITFFRFQFCKFWRFYKSCIFRFYEFKWKTPKIQNVKYPKIEIWKTWFWIKIGRNSTSFILAWFVSFFEGTLTALQFGIFDSVMYGLGSKQFKKRDIDFDKKRQNEARESNIC